MQLCCFRAVFTLPAPSWLHHCLPTSMIADAPHHTALRLWLEMLSLPEFVTSSFIESVNKKRVSACCRTEPSGFSFPVTPTSVSDGPQQHIFESWRSLHSTPSREATTPTAAAEDDTASTKQVRDNWLSAGSSSGIACRLMELFLVNQHRNIIFCAVMHGNFSKHYINTLIDISLNSWQYRSTAVNRFTFMIAADTESSAQPSQLLLSLTLQADGTATAAAGNATMDKLSKAAQKLECSADSEATEATLDPSGAQAAEVESPGSTTTASQDNSRKTGEPCSQVAGNSFSRGAARLQHCTQADAQTCWHAIYYCRRPC